MTFDKYETLPAASATTTHMAAGAIAGIMEHCAMYPLDSVKTRMQSLAPVPGGVYNGMIDTMSRMIKNEGFYRPFRGFSTVIFGAGPAHALYFSCYERIKELLETRTPSHYNHLVHGAAGSLATLFHDAIMTPADFVKQRMQMYNSPYRSPWDCIKKTYQAEGYGAFYRAYSTQLTMNIPFHSIHFTVYEIIQGITNKEKQYNPVAHMVSGGLAGGIAAAITTPLDVCKTLLNTQEKGALDSVGKPKISGLIMAAKTVFKLGGLRGFFQGISARVCYQMPATALSWSVYEFFKYFINKRDIEHSDVKKR